MSLAKAIEHGKEKRKPYRGAKAFDASCRCHGTCEYCRQGRLHKVTKRLVSAKEQEREALEDTQGNLLWGRVM